ncbi:SNAPc (Small Nuclear RNA Activating Complex) homolog [Caenorhabditis elegans]|uniref:SNAPc (Small Nuclear RNA Activating Complex) homolog n=1 Tax=Caenorhabditis elegans TaxID=6239 RepID=Q22950_CAEEL|nr:SNAPc (Small Nuclear RNA Activating Complex) homolog [Caenorhabditis elegans]CCD65599.1 SNAPc (Small Nuclear RNA Activating Complex) homolog [Caenorhabditis elegans]|eukprot:NP_001023772.1 SNAPc (Small Nuclear RNA Activating Complex) homolog [Caenorhabditis elegans]
MPKGGATSLIRVTAGLRGDLDEFLKAFLDKNTQRFSDYEKLFQHLGMIQLHNGKFESAQIIEFNEQLLVNCLTYMEENVCVGVPRSLEEQLFGLYSLYTFFYTQVSGHAVKIRVEPDTVLNFSRLTQLVLDEKIYDAYAICQKLLEDQAFKFVAFLHANDPTLFKRFGQDNEANPAKTLVNLNDPLGRFKALVESPVFAKLGLIHNEYARLKEEAGIVLDRFPLLNIQETCKKILEKGADELKGQLSLQIQSANSSSPLCSTPPTRSEIKEKAYGSGLKLTRSRRHCTTSVTKLPSVKFGFKSIDSVDEISKTAKRRKVVDGGAPSIPKDDILPSNPPVKRSRQKKSSSIPKTACPEILLAAEEKKNAVPDDILQLASSKPAINLESGDAEVLSNGRSCSEPCK